MVAFGGLDVERRSPRADLDEPLAEANRKSQRREHQLPRALHPRVLRGGKNVLDRHRRSHFPTDLSAETRKLRAAVVAGQRRLQGLVALSRRYRFQRLADLRRFEAGIALLRASAQGSVRAQLERQLYLLPLIYPRGGRFLVLL